MRKYRVNEVFYSLQGEGVRAGTPNVFVRFSGCNLTCNYDEHGFDCDTEFTSGVHYEAQTLMDLIDVTRTASCKNIIWTGGEPSLQLDETLTILAKQAGYHQAIETNGTHPLPPFIDWVSCSPKTAEHTLRVKNVSELKYVRRKGMGIPKPMLEAQHYLISPSVDSRGKIVQEDLLWCLELVRKHPKWRLSCQQHKQWAVR